MPNSYTPGLSHIRSITWCMFGTSVNVKHRVTGELHVRWNSDRVFLFPKQRVWWKICSTNTRPMLMGCNQVLDKHWQIIDHFKFMVVTGLLPHWSIEHSLSHTVAKRLWSALPILSLMREFLAMNSVTHSSISSTINKGGSWGAHNSWTRRQWQLRFLHHHGALDYDVILWPKMAKKRQEGGDSMWKNKTCLQILHDLKKRKIYVMNVVYTSPLSSITTCTHMTQSNVHTPHCTTPPSQWNILCQQV
jgi:hypothetical protein